ncbi:unnamed protein product [Paramecium sonneborni]|uniref:Uncharacterized protein n=1 Tax=Paramecium sonneborni TaxID=65129 RepID=A0A8S1NA51_9CILI|nr:unnamed protein product [Paramecium sonneborni]
MNTVLHDTMMLCLTNGQCIKLSTQVRILFEVEDQIIAFPAIINHKQM